VHLEAVTDGREDRGVDGGFSIASPGFVIGAARLPLPSWAQGLIFGILLSLPEAIITKTYAPILILGAVGGVIIGLIVGKWGA